MKQLKENLERILKVRDADLGLFILAMHSLIERTLKEKYGINSYDSENTFGKLIDRYTTEFYETHGTPIFPGSEKRNFPKNEWNLLKNLNIKRLRLFLVILNLCHWLKSLNINLLQLS